MSDQMPTFPPADLAESRHPLFDGEWRYGPDRGLWTGGYPVTATAEPVDGVTVSITGPLGLDRDGLAGFIGWLTAVHAASEPYGPGKCACAGHLPEFTHSHGVASCVAGGAS